jgi:uncharacterized Ntn-hydrolase superfamily protein
MHREFRMLGLGGAFVLLAMPLLLGTGQVPGGLDQPILANTFSIVAFDPDHEEWGVAVASRVPAVGAAVPWSKTGVGAIATQSLTNVSYGPHGLDQLAEGKTAQQVVKALTDADTGRELRQLAIVDTNGNVAVFTGKKCNPWAGHKTGKHYSCQGNLLAGEAVVEDMAKAFGETTGPFVWRLLAAMEAGEKAGGDKRGKQSAAIQVVRDKAAGSDPWRRYIDFRVDDHPTPIAELARLVALRVKRPKAAGTGR